ncbi:MAG: FABP family protein [Thermoleophilia bacterium]|nr:FABP family protein [Thermoleophilia bacterium]
MSARLHPDLAPLAHVSGTWRGGGEGEYPTIEPFAYEEEMRFWHHGTGYLAYAQRAWAPADGRTLHSELGFWRPAGAGRLEVCLAHPLGLTEIALGQLDGPDVRLASVDVPRAPGGSPVTRLERRYRFEGEALSYELWLATERTPLARHLVGRLEREG